MARQPDWYIPNWVPRSSAAICCLLVFTSCITSTTTGYDGSMMNGLNMEPQYTDYFHLNEATTGLMTASIYVGGAVSGIWYGKVTDQIGRRPALLWAAVITIFAVILQAAAQNAAMFIIARILIGLGTSASGITGPTYLAETLPLQWRAWGLGFFNDFYYVGGLLAAGITYATANYSSTWAWRTPSLVQGAFSVICVLIIPFVPESPRWLVFNGRIEEAGKVLALTHANGNEADSVVQAHLKQIVETIEYEKNVGETLSLKQMVKTPSARKRVLLAISVAVFSTISGNVAASYYLGDMLDDAGITNTTTQLQINIILNAWCLVCSICGTFACDKLGRKPTTVASTASLTGFIFMIGALTKVYGKTTYHPGIYATVASIFLFQGAYSFGWTPILYLYPPEVLNYPIRANGMGVFQFFLNGTAILFVFMMPTALKRISWKFYMINGGWDILMLVIVIMFWVETKGKTLEDVDEVIDGVSHSSVWGIEHMPRNEEGAEVVTKGGPAYTASK